MSVVTLTPGGDPVRDRELLYSPTLPCRVCGAGVSLTRHMQATKLRDRALHHLHEARDAKAASDHYMAHYHYDRARGYMGDLEALPGVVCRGRHNACPIRWAECERCGESFPARRSTARYCSGRCRTAIYRQG